MESTGPKHNGPMSSANGPTAPSRVASFTSMNGLTRIPSIQVHSPDEKPGKYKTEFEDIRVECIQKGLLYEDPEFPPLDSSIYFSCKPNYKFEWLRPHDLAGRYGLNPELHPPGSRFSLIQGVLGDYWLLQAASCLYENPELSRHVIPNNQSFSSRWYAGLFRFHFWRYGKWQEVIVDDRLPTVRGEMAFIHSKEPNVFWGALLEKAYAKLLGSYEALKSGLLCNALQSLTGGVVESYLLKDSTLPLPGNIVNALFKAMERHSVILVHVKPIQGRTGGVLPNGLIAGKIYSLTDIREIKLISGTGEVPITLIRLLNPYGEKVVWNGSWGERSEEWTNIPPHDRQAMGLVCRQESEFWMDFKDYIMCCDSMDVCHQLPDIAPLSNPPRVWRGLTFHGAWRKGVNTGGRPICAATHHLNPQYHLRMSRRDEEESNRSTCLVELTQKDRRKVKHTPRITADIGFVLYQCTPDHPVPLPQAFFDQHTFYDRCDYYANGETVSKRFLLEQGDYILIPSTYTAHTEADYMLRLLMEEDNTAE